MPGLGRSLSISAAAIWLIASAAQAADALSDDADPAARYGACMELARKNPEAGFESALAWRDMGGGLSAEHCAATALNANGQHAVAARRFEDIAQRIKKESQFKAAILGHAAQAWLLAGDPDRTIAVLDAAIALDPLSAGFLVDRAEAHAARKDYKSARIDLDVAVHRDPYDVDALVFRASTRRYLEDMAGAREDVDRALDLDPGNPDALLERGILKRLTGDNNGARQDWAAVVTTAPEASAATAAQRNLELLDVRQDPK